MSNKDFDYLCSECQKPATIHYAEDGPWTDCCLANPLNRYGREIDDGRLQEINSELWETSINDAIHDADTDAEARYLEGVYRRHGE